MSEAVIGLTVVAAGTSLPEFATSIVASLRGQPDMSVGTIVGSNIFNILGILGVAAVCVPVRAPGIGAQDLWVMVGFATALLPLLWTRRMLQRWEGGLLLGCYVFYVVVRWPGG